MPRVQGLNSSMNRAKNCCFPDAIFVVYSRRYCFSFYWLALNAVIMISNLILVFAGRRWSNLKGRQNRELGIRKKRGSGCVTFFVNILSMRVEEPWESLETARWPAGGSKWCCKRLHPASPNKEVTEPRFEQKRDLIPKPWLFPLHSTHSPQDTVIGL